LGSEVHKQISAERGNRGREFEGKNIHATFTVGKKKKRRKVEGT